MAVMSVILVVAWNSQFTQGALVFPILGILI